MCIVIGFWDSENITYIYVEDKIEIWVDLEFVRTKCGFYFGPDKSGISILSKNSTYHPFEICPDQSRIQIWSEQNQNIGGGNIKVSEKLVAKVPTQLRLMVRVKI